VIEHAMVGGAQGAERGHTQLVRRAALEHALDGRGSAGYQTGEEPQRAGAHEAARVVEQRSQRVERAGAAGTQRLRAEPAHVHRRAAQRGDGAGGRRGVDRRRPRHVAPI
jgi:hypothetical protein